MFVIIINKKENTYEKNTEIQMTKRLISVRIESEDFEKLQKEAGKNEITFSKLIRRKLNKNSDRELKGGHKEYATAKA